MFLTGGIAGCLKTYGTLRQLVLLFPAYTDMCWFKYYEPGMVGKNLKLAILSLELLEFIAWKQIGCYIQQFTMDACMGMNRV